MNDYQENLIEKMRKLEEKLQDFDSAINLAQKQKEHYQKQFLEVSRELTNSILFEKIKSEVHHQ